MILLAVGAYIWRCASVSSTLPEYIELTALCNTKMQVLSQGHDSIVNLKRGTCVQFLGYVHDHGFRIWARTSDGLRGMIPQEAFNDTLIVGRALKNYAFGESLIFAGYDGKGINPKVRVGKGNVADLADHEAREVISPIVIKYSKFGINSKGSRILTQSEFKSHVLGRNISALDSTFSPVIYRSKDKAQLGVEVFSRRTGYFHQPVLEINPEGEIVSISDDPNIKKLPGFRGFVLRKLPYAGKIMQAFSASIAPPIYSVSKMGDFNRDKYILEKFGWDFSSTINFTWWMWVVLIIVSAIYFCVLALQWAGYYIVLQFIGAIVVMALCQKSQPLKFIPNPVLKILLWLLTLCSFNVALVLCMANQNSLWLIVLPLVAIFGYEAVYRGGNRLITRRCPCCKTLASYKLDRTVYGEPFTVKDEDLYSEYQGSSLVDKFKSFKRTITTTRYADGTTETKPHDSDPRQSTSIMKVQMVQRRGCQPCGTLYKILLMPGVRTRVRG